MNYPERWLAALPVYNEAQYVTEILDQVVQYADDVLVVDDGSNDGTAALLAERDDISVVHHSQNRGYGAALVSAFQHAINLGFDGLVTLDCDGQHQPCAVHEQRHNPSKNLVLGGKSAVSPCPVRSNYRLHRLDHQDH